MLSVHVCVVSVVVDFASLTVMPTASCHSKSGVSMRTTTRCCSGSCGWPAHGVCPLEAAQQLSPHTLQLQAQRPRLGRPCRPPLVGSDTNRIALRSLLSRPTAPVRCCRSHAHTHPRTRFPLRFPTACCCLCPVPYCLFTAAAAAVCVCVCGLCPGVRPPPPPSPCSVLFCVNVLLPSHPWFVRFALLVREQRQRQRRAAVMAL